MDFEKRMPHWRFFLFASGTVLYILFTLLCQFRLYTSAELPHLPPFSHASEVFPNAAELSKLIEARVALLERTGAHEGLERDKDSAVFSLRPALKLKGVIVSGKRNCAMVSVEGEKSVRVLFEGQSAAGVLFKEITQNGVRCEWRGSPFFLPFD